MEGKLELEGFLISWKRYCPFYEDGDTDCEMG
jgi:hypothetical protein